MLKALLIILHRAIIWRKHGVSWIFLCFMLSGSHSLIKVEQIPVVVSPLSHNVTLKCELIYSSEDKPTNIPILYWELLSSDRDPPPRLWPKGEPYEGRVEQLETNATAQNKSILLKDVRWEDSGVYQCKLSIKTKSAGYGRIKGRGTVLRVFDAIFFNATAEHDNQLQCAVRVSHDLGFVLSVTHDGLKQTIDSIAGNNVSDLPYVPLAGSVPLSKFGDYECQLHLNDTLIDRRTFQHNPPEPEKTDYPQPWLLYVAILQTPLTVLLFLLTAMLLYPSAERVRIPVDRRKTS
ncbi:uncharacterized protein LOC130118634 [Lampris incognitus]|uniref:uncharacterized protein LOC130118634 n=1 Tax=Lampris incognitus TaxID=2546036 RepID=UPI0024B4DDC7|nr:uncharacterized protein LOC130118634 [Lampris incognitus]